MTKWVDPVSSTLFRSLTVASHAPVADTPAQVTVVGAPGYRVYLAFIGWSYSATPTGGRLTIAGLEGDDLVLDITQGGPGPLYGPPFAGELSTNVVITLAAGGGGVSGRVSVAYALLPKSLEFNGLRLAHEDQ